MLVDLREIVVQMLVEQSPEQAERFDYRFGILPERCSLKEAIHELNNFWRLQLANVPESTSDVRSYLGDDMNVEIWLHHFKTKILPEVLKHQLPQ